MSECKYADKTMRVKLVSPEHDRPDAPIHGKEIRVEGWCQDVFGCSWMNANGNFAAMHYGMRCGLSGLPVDNKVLYGKVGFFGHCVHETELEEIDEAPNVQ